MRIDTLSAFPDRAGRYGVRFSDGSTMRLYRQTIEDFALCSGKELSETDMDHLRCAAGRMSAKMRAVRIVSASNVSKRDLEQRLVRKGEDPKQARDAVLWMEDLNLVDDRKTAELIVSRCIQRGYGLNRAKQALYEKQIPKALWEEALAEYPDQEERIQAFLEEKLSCGSGQNEVRRAVDALLRRGHSYGVIRHCLDRLNLEAEDD